MPCTRIFLFLFFRESLRSFHKFSPGKGQRKNSIFFFPVDCGKPVIPRCQIQVSPRIVFSYFWNICCSSCAVCTRNRTRNRKPPNSTSPLGVSDSLHFSSVAWELKVTLEWTKGWYLSRTDTALLPGTACLFIHACFQNLFSVSLSSTQLTTVVG